MIRSFARVLLALALLATAVFIWSRMPTKLQSWAPIVEHGRVGEQISGRNLRVTVHDVALATELIFTEDGVAQHVPTTGVWIVLDVSYETIDMFAEPEFALDAGGRHFRAYFGGFRGDVDPGFPERAPVAFEVPEKPSSATLLVSNEATDRYGNTLNAPLDSQIAVTADLTDTPLAPIIDLDLADR